MRLPDRFLAAVQRRRVPASFAFTVLAIFLADPSLNSILAGGTVSILGTALRAWAVGYLRKDQELTTSGPYAYTRNPLYLGSFLIGLGVILACSSWVLMGLYLGLFTLLYSATMIREGAHLLKLFPHAYTPYREAVPLFLPRITPYRPGEARYSFALYLNHREYRVVIALLVVFGLLFGKVALASATPWKVQAQANAATATSDVSRLPFSTGETLVYEARFSKLFLSGKIGRLTFSFDRCTEPPLVGSHYVRAEAVSEGFWPSVLGLQVKDIFESFIDPSDFGVLRTRKDLQHNKKREFELAVFDRRGGVMLIRRDLSGGDTRPELKQEMTRSWVQDVVSAFYYVRTLPLEKEEVIEVPVSDSGKTFEVRIRILGREHLITDSGEYDSIKLQPLIFGEDKLIRREGDFYLWLSDDVRRLPIMALVQGSFGTATLELISTTGGGH